MSGLLEQMTEKALARNIPLSVQLDLTYRCNERCVHCYLDHDDHGEMTTAEVKHLLDEMADAGVFILTLSGGEIFLRKDFFEILEYARFERQFCVKLKTNALMIREREAARIRDIGVDSIQISIYSHKPKVHDAITLVPGSLKRSLDAARFLKSQGLRVIFANVLMVQNLQDYKGVRALAEELGVECTLDPTITPMMDGDRSVLSLGVNQEALRQVFRDQALVGDVDEFCTIAAPADENALSA
ncbi:MAG TPA: radical SAM protein, partial [Candidatus Udaeobacter sp.]|nr:radical SAM protein [Candidatus Udaeobacter sp.]